MESTKRKESLRERVRKIGQSGNYWYAMELSKNLKKGKSVEVQFWDSPIALYRGEDGKVRALENRCAHRQLRLTTGVVSGNDIICQYHGWTYDEAGKCTHIAHELGKGKTNKVPDIKIRSYPVKEKYGLIWVFPGDPEKAGTVAIPAIPQLDQEKPWKYIPIDITINAHYSMVLENVCDFNHAFLHRDYRPFTDPHLKDHYRKDDTITIEYDTDLSQSQVVKMAGEKQGKQLDEMTLWYKYPYQASDIAGKYLHWLFMTPVSERETRCIFIFLFGALEIPVVQWEIPRIFRKPLISLINKFYVVPLLKQDLWALQEEQLGFDRYPAEHHYEFNPIVHEFQRMSLEKWEEYIDSEASRIKPVRGRYEDLGAGLNAKMIVEHKKAHNGQPEPAS